MCDSDGFWQTRGVIGSFTLRNDVVLLISGYLLLVPGDYATYHMVAEEKKYSSS